MPRVPTLPDSDDFGQVDEAIALQKMTPVAGQRPAIGTQDPVDQMLYLLVVPVRCTALRPARQRGGHYLIRRSPFDLAGEFAGLSGGPSSEPSLLVAGSSTTTSRLGIDSPKVP